MKDVNSLCVCLNSPHLAQSRDRRKSRKLRLSFFFPYLGRGEKTHWLVIDTFSNPFFFAYPHLKEAERRKR